MEEGTKQLNKKTINTIERIVFLCLIFALVAFTSVAQTQTGYVKTRGRIVNGQHVHGQGLVGATVQIKGKNSVVVQNSNGSFSFPISSKQFVIQSVKKNGYQLVDADAAPKTYTQSANPIYLVMDIPSQQMEDKLAAERKMRRTLSKQLLQRQDEIEALKEQNRITSEEYHKALQQLNDEQEKSLNMVSEMAERYSMIDFDLLDEFNRRVSECIIEGRLIEADSLIKSKGDLMGRIAAYNRHHEANEQARKYLEDSETMEIKDRDDIAQDCHSQFLIHKLQHHPDSAAFYIEQRAMLDTTNVDWLCDAANYFKESGKYDKALTLYLIAHNQHDINKDGDILVNIATINSLLGKTSSVIQAYERAIEAYKITKLDSITKLSKLLMCYTNLDVESLSYDVTKGRYYRTLGEEALDQIESLLDSLFSNNIMDFEKYSHIDINVITDKTISFKNRVLLAIEARYGHYSMEAAEKYIELGRAYWFDEKEKAIDCYEKAQDIIHEIDSTNPMLGKIFGELARLYSFKPNRTEQDVLKSIDYDLNAIIVYSHNYGFNHPHLYNIYHRLARLYYKTGNDSLALQYYLREIELKNRLYNDGFEIADAQIGIANIYERQNNDTIALKYYLEALDSQKKWAINTSEINNFRKIYVYEKYLGEFYLRHHDFEAALSSFMNSLSNLEEYGGSPPATLYGNIGLCYVALSDSCSGIEYLLKALERFSSSIERLNSSDYTDDMKVQIEKCIEQKKKGQYSESLHSVLKILENLNVDDGQKGDYGVILLETQWDINKLRDGLSQVLNEATCPVTKSR